MTPAILGFNLVCWAAGCFSTPGGQKSLQGLAETGASWLAVVQTQMTDSKHASRLSGRYVDTEEDVRAEIRRAKGLGLKVALKPHLDVADGSVRALIAPSDLDAWWRDYERYALDYARVAAEEKADLFVVGTELARLAAPTHAGRWKHLIAEVRKVYGGPLTYAANWYDYPLVPFWRELDYIGIDGYFPIPEGSHRLALKAGWKIWKAGVAAQAHVYGKPVLFTEFGCSSQKGANLKPWEWNRMGAVDLELQKNYYETFLEAFGKERWFAGVLVWGWDIDPDSGGPESFGLTVQHKPVLESLKRFFASRRAEAAPTGLAPARRDALERRVGALLKRAAQVVLP